MGGERLDTRNPTSKLMLIILAGVATWERKIMLERQREGIAKAKAEGRYKGRPPFIDVAEMNALFLATTAIPTIVASEQRIHMRPRHGLHGVGLHRQNPNLAVRQTLLR
jgi:DNA invertase Pin-like site-specific DNA recombinase